MSSSSTPPADASMDMPPMDRRAPADLSHTAFALGCFWGPDALFGAQEGVVRTTVGYADGGTPAPTYEDIGDHIEAVRVAYDPDQVSYADLLALFWTAHDPTRAPLKRQYQSALFPATPEQAEQARASRSDVAAAHDGALSTEIIADAPFTRAEPYHQKHKLRRHSAVADPLRAVYPADRAFADSPAAALANGYVGGHRSPTRLTDDAARLGLPTTATEALRTIAEDRHRA
ncbi:peptide-methionine (S)-S-oxide reductase [Salinibacter ruber]|uniref:peptide-methionine (S)-S-oxide reductase n=1 Tax=Salinibacter ruber TaxID=146919 RepID=UPI002169851D|nr:peptide-methionine (S)-S-oxide reductase [Salinibacter ruber]MCS3627667.1 peptide-methionine (S)-S-oxide reductase [Salinibacter ruber]MCS4144575.1 peptide-methionine (S)-S-oxide reductase [Salinibacter ruber]